MRILLMTVLCCLAAPLHAESLAPENMLLIEQYRMARDAEIALARSAAPPSVSGDAEVMVLGGKGYEIAANGANGFVCLVSRSWGAPFNDAEFWNPLSRGPICYNAAAARSMVPAYVERTKWVLEGVSKSEMMARTKAAFASHKFRLPEAGAMCFMMSKDGYLNGAHDHWHPHLMFFVGNSPGADWGADKPGTGIYAAQADPDPVTTYVVPVPNWSDGTPYAPMSH
jgi:hypothetical protein